MLDLEISPMGTRMPKRSEVAGTVVRALRESDVELLSGDRNVKPEGLVKRLSHRHHMLARLLANGVKPGDAALIAGYVGSRVSILQGDPSFRELVEFYKRETDAAFASMHERILGLSEDALEELRTRLEEAPEDFSNAMLLDIMSKAADRAGHGPSATQVNVNVNMADRLRLARERADRAKMIEGEVE